MCRDSKHSSCIPQRKALLKGILMYFKLVWYDVACILCLAFILFCIVVPDVVADPVYDTSKRFVPLWEWTKNSGFHGQIELSYPYTTPLLSTGACTILVLLGPVFIIGLFQFLIQSWWDFHAAVAGNIRAVLFATLISVILKQQVGGFRPHFLAVCKPDIDICKTKVTVDGIVFVTPQACTGNKHDVVWALQSFPSGHTATCFAAAVFLAFYMNAKLKTFADFQTNCLVVFVNIAPLIVASVIAGNLLAENHHHPSDIIFGAIIGFICGTMAYRNAYASVFDFRFNHIPLPPTATKMRLSYDTIGTLGDPDDGAMAGLMNDEFVDTKWWVNAGANLQSNQKRWLKSVCSLRATGTQMDYTNFVGTFLKRKGGAIKGDAPEGLAEAQPTKCLMSGGVGVGEETDQSSVSTLPHMRGGRLYRSL